MKLAVRKGRQKSSELRSQVHDNDVDPREHHRERDLAESAHGHPPRGDGAELPEEVRRGPRRRNESGGHVRETQASAASARPTRLRSNPDVGRISLQVLEENRRRGQRLPSAPQGSQHRG